LHVGPAHLVDQMAALGITLVGLDLDGLRRLDLLSLGVRYLELKRFHEPDYDLVLKPEDIGRGPIDLGRSDQVSARSLGEMRGDAECLPHLLESAPYDPSHTQRAAQVDDLLFRDLPAHAASQCP